MDNPENKTDDSKNTASTSVELLKQTDSQNIPSTSRYGRARKPKSYFKDYYNTDEVIKNPLKRATKSTSPKMQSPNSRKKSKSDDFVHVTGDADITTTSIRHLPIQPLAETTEDNFENFVKSVSEHTQDLKTADSLNKESESLKLVQDISEGSSEESIGVVNEVQKVEQTAETQKITLKTYGNKRKKPGMPETLVLSDKSLVYPQNTSINPNIDAVINMSDTNQITIDTSNKNTTSTTFFGITLSPEKPRELPKAKQPLKTLITSVTRIATVQPTVTKVKSVLSGDTTKKIFASVSKQKTITIVPKLPCKQQESEVSLVGDIPTCKIKSITPMNVLDAKMKSNNNQEKKFVRVVMDKSKILKVMPTSGGSPIKLFDTSSDSDKSFTSPPFSPVKPTMATFKKVPLPTVIQPLTVYKPNLSPTTSNTQKTLENQSPKIIASCKLIRKDPIAPVNVVNVPSAHVLSPNVEIIARKRKQELILRKDIDHSYSILTSNLPIAPKKKFIAQMKIVDVQLDGENDEIKSVFVDKLIDDKKADELLVKSCKEEEISLEISKETDVKELIESKTDEINENHDLESTFVDVNKSPIVRLELTEDKQVEETIETPPQKVFSKSVSKTAVRVSPRKGKGTNAFLWETNTRAFFIKQNIKNKMPDILMQKDSGVKDELVDLKEEIEAEKSCLEEKEVGNKKSVGKTTKKALAVVKNTRKNRNTAKLTKNSSENQTEISERQLRTRKYIFAEQIAAKNRKTIPKTVKSNTKVINTVQNNDFTSVNRKIHTSKSDKQQIIKTQPKKKHYTKQSDDVILISAQKSVIIINSDDETDNVKSDFVVPDTEIKKEIVTPEEVVASKVAVPKRRHRFGRKGISKLALVSDFVEGKVLGRGIGLPMPIGDSGVDLEVKEEKMDAEDDGLIDGAVIVKKEGSEEYNEGDMVWAKVGCHPYWPAMITRDPLKNSIKQTISFKNTVPYYHVRYFADNGRRSWVRATALMQYQNRTDLDVLLKFAGKNVSTSKKYIVPKIKFKLWNIAVEELESIKTHPIAEKLNFFNTATIRSVTKKRISSPRFKAIKREKPDDFYDDYPPNICYKTLSSTRKIPILIPNIKTPTTTRLRLSSYNLPNYSPRSHIDRFLQTQFEDKTSWKRMRLLIDDKSDDKLKDLDTTDCSSSETDSVQNKVPLFGPIPCSTEYQELLRKRHNLFRKISREKVCEVCFKPANVLSCKGPCEGFYHLDCANGYLNEPKKGANLKSRERFEDSSDADSKVMIKDRKGSTKCVGNSFVCGNCDRNEPCVCFVCLKDVSTSGEEEITKCKVAKCGKAFHRGCTRLWPQAQWLTTPANPNIDITSIICPRHVCHICVSDDPKAASARACRSEALVHCLLCPATYHSVTACIPAGTEIYTHSQIICPRHLTLPNTGILSRGSGNILADPGQVKEYFTKPLPPINTTWCFICSSGGDLVCCETCPTSVHETCSPINRLDDDSYICEDCETGRLILHDEVVWAKLGAYRWWPALVLYPRDVPPNIRTLRHRRGEFVIKFFGSYDHYWMGHGRVFLYQEGDTGATVSKNAKRMDVAFAKAIEEAAEAFALKRDFKKSLLQSDSHQPKSLKPPAYIKIRFNKPVGNVKIYDANVSITTPCSCDPNSESPCGPNTNCINRLLWTECHPQNCPAGNRCQNQLFETRCYPPLMPYKTDGRGWGLKTLVPLSSGQFVIEYVGEIIEEQEYKRRIEKMQNQSEKNYYFLTIDSDRIIDAGPKGNMARFMNHSCDPNCETQKWTVNGDTRVGLFACDNIPANKELTFNYNLSTNGKTFLECKCKAATCSGFIGVKKAADNPKATLASKKILMKRKKRYVKSKKMTVKNISDKVCFVCGEADKLITCSNLTCGETFHVKCVHLMNIPRVNWRCPRHYCTICRKKIVKRCKLCTKSFCMQHCNIKSEGKIVEFTCSDHTNTSKPTNETTKNTKSEHTTKKIDDVLKKTAVVESKQQKKSDNAKINRANKKIAKSNLKKKLSSQNESKKLRLRRELKNTEPSKRQLRYKR